MQSNIFRIVLIISLICFTRVGLLHAQEPPDTLKVQDTTATALSDSIPKKVITAKERKRMERDSIRAYNDSIRIATPRILKSYIVPDSIRYKRILVWNSDKHFNKISFKELDTTANSWFTEYPFFKEDINADYLGIVGSATQSHNFFKRKESEYFSYFTPYLTYSHTTDNMPFYNTKSAYTELAYWGTLFAYKDKEEASIKFLHTQNITPSLNFSFLYQKYGAKGLLQNEGTDTRTTALTFNNLGERYIMHGGFIRNTVKRSENGGVSNPKEITDTIVDAKTISTILTEANNKLARSTFFINHSYSIPFNFFRKKDTLAIGEGTVAFLGHYGEYSTYSKCYADKIAITDKQARDFYNNTFYINNTSSADSLHMTNFDNRFFIRLQPWASDAIISKIEGGLGYQLLSYYNFDLSSYLTGNKNKNLNNLYIYAGASGQLKKYFSWDAFGKYQYSGYYQNDFLLNAKATFAFYPFKKTKEGIYLTAAFKTSLQRPDWYDNNYFSNHYAWSNNFDKVSKTSLEGNLSIPHWKTSAFFGYSLISGYTYYDTTSVIRQDPDIINVMSAYLKKDLKVWMLHFDHQALFQLSSKPSVLQLPLLSLNLRYYLEFPVVKGVMTMQLGASATFNTLYFAPAYNPALGVFHLQEREKLGNAPYIDVFANIQWKRASIFVKYTNATLGWPNGDYFSTYRYIRPQRGLKFGIHWPFYVH